jgi:hypothetical protein
LGDDDGSDFHDDDDDDVNPGPSLSASPAGNEGPRASSTSSLKSQRESRSMNWREIHKSRKEHGASKPTVTASEYYEEMLKIEKKKLKLKRKFFKLKESYYKDKLAILRSEKKTRSTTSSASQGTPVTTEYHTLQPAPLWQPYHSFENN